MWFIICDERKIEYIGQTGGQSKDRPGIYWQYIRQPECQHSNVEDQLKVCGEGIFGILPFLNMWI